MLSTCVVEACRHISIHSGSTFIKGSFDEKLPNYGFLKIKENSRVENSREE